MVWGINLLLVTWTRVILWPQQLSDHGHREPPSPSRRATKIIGSEAAGRTQTESLRQHKQSVVEWNLMSIFLYLFLSCLVSDFISFFFYPIALDKLPYCWAMISLHFISRSNVQMQNTDLGFVSIVCGEWGTPSLGCGGHLAERLMVSLRAAGKAGVRKVAFE